MLVINYSNRVIGIIRLERLFPSSFAEIDFKIQCRIKISLTSRPIGTSILWCLSLQIQKDYGVELIFLISFEKQ